jgi:hypothetical protein
MRCFGIAGIAGISASITRTRKPISTCKVARFAATKLFPAEGIGPITIRRLLRACAGRHRRASTRGMVRRPRAEDSGVVGYSDAAAAVLAALPTN